MCERFKVVATNVKEIILDLDPHGEAVLEDEDVADKARQGCVKDLRWFLPMLKKLY